MSPISSIKSYITDWYSYMFDPLYQFYQTIKTPDNKINMKKLYTMEKIFSEHKNRYGVNPSASIAIIPSSRDDTMFAHDVIDDKYTYSVGECPVLFDICIDYDNSYCTSDGTHFLYTLIGYTSAGRKATITISSPSYSWHFHMD